MVAKKACFLGRNRIFGKIYRTSLAKGGVRSRIGRRGDVRAVFRFAFSVSRYEEERVWVVQDDLALAR